MNSLSVMTIYKFSVMSSLCVMTVYKFSVMSSLSIMTIYKFSMMNIISVRMNSICVRNSTQVYNTKENYHWDY